MPIMSFVMDEKGYGNKAKISDRAKCTYLHKLGNKSNQHITQLITGTLGVPFQYQTLSYQYKNYLKK